MKNGAVRQHELWFLALGLIAWSAAPGCGEDDAGSGVRGGDAAADSRGGGDGAGGDGGAGDGASGDGAGGDGATTDGAAGDGATGDGAGGDNGQGDGAVGDSAGSDVMGPEPTPGEIGWPCSENRDCNSEWCVPGPNGYICTEECLLECPRVLDYTFLCRPVQTGSGDPSVLCWPEVRDVCTPCSDDLQCSGGRCLEIDGDRRCAAECDEDVDCPDGYSCGEDAAGGRSGQFCQPTSGSCDCTPGNNLGQRSCEVPSDFGTCRGFQTCDPSAGWGDCDAPEPVAEVCDGLDNNCNAFIDDGVGAGDLCETTVDGVGTCRGTNICLGADGGLVCNAPTPTVETCDVQDNDCDGEVDEDFRASDGTWTLKAHCGFCNNDCTGRIPNGTATCREVDGAPRCVAAACLPGFVETDGFCVAPGGGGLCFPCIDDASCPGGDKCLEIGGEMMCSRDCGPGNQYGAEDECPADFACEAQPGGEKQCVPTNDSCTCRPTNDGQGRICVNSNALGSCFGTQLCDASVGWSACNAALATAETCDGLDNDCNGLQDDDLGIDPTCTREVASVGTCTGDYVCLGVSGLVCSAPEPQLERCDLLDNDCDGSTDEDFKAPDGTWTLTEHCGFCGNDCTGRIPNGVAMCEAVDGQPRCVAASCEDGFFEQDGFCKQLAGGLCFPCVNDASCNAGDQCIALDDGSFCSRDCGPGNVYGVPEDDCPTGFFCEAQPAGGKVCVPDNNSCGCGPSNDGEQRACVNDNAFGTCFGTRVCDAASGWTDCTAAVPEAEVCNGLDDDCNAIPDDLIGRGTACSIDNASGSCPGIMGCEEGGPSTLVCIGSTPADEVCNLIDDDCEGGTDEDFKIAGEYITDAACGSCFTDCTSVFARPAAYGTCDSSGAAPTCALGCCTIGDANPSCDGIYDYYNLNGVPDDGCEFRLDPDAIYVSIDEADPLGADDADCGFGPIGTGSSPVSPFNPHHPCRSIAYATQRALDEGRSTVLVASGTYAEDVVLVDGVNLRGGNNVLTWGVNAKANLTVITGQSGAGHRMAVSNASPITTPTEFSGFVIQGAIVSETSRNSYGLYLTDACGLSVSDVTIFGGAGGPGSPGDAGPGGGSAPDGLGRTLATIAEYDSYDTGEQACNDTRQESNGAAFTCGGGAVSVAGGDGGGNRCRPVFNTEFSGLDGFIGNSGPALLDGAAGLGGDAGDDMRRASDCFCYLPNPGPDSSPGNDGGDGQDAPGGNGCAAVAGTIDGAGHWSGGTGVDGINGGHGGGGGGGGAGGGAMRDGCGNDRLGGHGGGGGAGGCGGTAGLAGLGGGASIGVFVNGGSCAPTITRTSVLRGFGGNGGPGGAGGAGGSGGAGGFGGECAGSCLCLRPGGRGGSGGSGGSGGGGGGGCGGGAYGFMSVGVGSPGYCGGTNAVGSGAAGSGGSGGNSFGSPGGAGVDGEVVDCREL